MKAPACYFFIALRFFFGGGDLTEAAVQSKFDYIIIPEKDKETKQKKKNKSNEGPEDFQQFLGASWFGANILRD